MKSKVWLAAAMAVLTGAIRAAEVAAQRPGGPGGGRGGRPSFDKLLNAFDANGDGVLEESEVPDRVWQRLSQADADQDGGVTRAEFESYRP